MAQSVLSYSSQKAHQVANKTNSIAKDTTTKALSLLISLFNSAKPYLPQPVISVTERAAEEVVLFSKDPVKEFKTYCPTPLYTTLEKTANYATETVKIGSETLSETQQNISTKVFGTIDYTRSVVHSTTDYTKSVVTSAADTLKSHTPDPVVLFIKNSYETALALKQHPIEVVRPYVPEVVHAGTTISYSVVQNTLAETQGFIIKQVNGTVEYIAHIPLFESFLSQLKDLLAVKESNSEEQSNVETETKEKGEKTENDE
ncbi:hypothetical protein HK099_008020 [Clydaea vesicula]|uniref:Uncharacterized protein n=1 Tax=Clydaea vesicula TaxID=447962 RepID=A0AAD5Y2J8_9FUNG|nr:hypothetical protein HK099_008020 [Clydaea vesicula]KAJ3391740.1 hypothetical protein HDU92_008884 [Lobulomyces angularis]